MEPQKNSVSLRNTLRVDCDSEKTRNYKDTPKQRGTNDNSGNVFTSTSHEIEANLVTQNGPCPRNLNTTNNETSPSSHKSNDDNTECNKNFSSIHNNKENNCNSELLAIEGTSKSENNIFDNNKDLQSCQKHKLFLDRVGNSTCNMPSTSGTIKAYDNADGNGSREQNNRKRPSSLKLNKSPLDVDDSSSDTGNDDYSLGSEDGCIYTYRGGEHLADLPSSFFSLDMGLPLDKHLPHAPNYPGQQQGAANARENNSGASSPDMDFLEMDFDPGPSCEADTGDESSPDGDLEEVINMPEENEPVVRGTSPEYMAAVKYNPLVCMPTTSTVNYTDSYCCSVPSTSHNVSSEDQDAKDDSEVDHTFGPLITHINVKGEQLLVRRTMSNHPIIPSGSNLHVSNGDLVSPREILNYDEDHTEGPFAHQINQGERPTFDSSNLSSAFYHLTMAKKLVENATSISDPHATDLTSDPDSSSAEDSHCSLPPRCMVWSEREACERQVTQIGTSACGATAVVNVFIALGLPVNIQKINSSVGTRLRANNAPLPRYLLSRAVAGCTAGDIVTGIQRASDGLVTARFFPTYPERAMSLSHWLADWISLGAVPIVTLNLQVGCDGEIPDAWHHQMVFGVSHRGIYLCNPVECVRESTLWPRLTSPSVLLVRTRDVLTRFTSNTDLSPLMMVPDQRFHTFNVLEATRIRLDMVLGLGHGAAEPAESGTDGVRLY
ncbi:unnamed protein product [Diatraea saccharalis]|uniref:Uncharacterized protein n=1 Tax=Diatraea saccharalis TaxID=40085 RepID=A0A9N9RFK9_9NEOP|nr:unnamed protein product [Diatraea saccharalis]